MATQLNIHEARFMKDLSRSYCILAVNIMERHSVYAMLAFHIIHFLTKVWSQGLAASSGTKIQSVTALAGLLDFISPLIFLKIQLFSTLRWDYFLFMLPSVTDLPPVFVRAAVRAVQPSDFVLASSSKSTFTPRNFTFSMHVDVWWWNKNPEKHRMMLNSWSYAHYSK